jgi:tetratricopeptide (TPR) repeat protein
MLRRTLLIRWPEWLLAGAFCLGIASPALLAQSTTPPAPAPKDDNPFPGDAPQTPAAQSGQSATPKPSPKSTSDNPFPGEDTNVPIIPAPGSSGSDAAGNPAGNPTGEPGRIPRRDADPDGDPVRSPDGMGNYAPADTFSSSRSGLTHLPAEDDSGAPLGKSAKTKTREQLIKEDVDVGSFYLEKKDWKGAEARFQSAFTLDSENPDAVWGMAEAERHLQLYKESAEHYKLFLTYDPDSKHGREARKALEEVEAAKASAANGSK